eukprot:1187375-Pyramimonas_sp.AAC.2
MSFVWKCSECRCLRATVHTQAKDPSRGDQRDQSRRLAFACKRVHRGLCFRAGFFTEGLKDLERVKVKGVQHER